MNNHRRMNVIIGGLVTLASFLIYLRTIAPTTSFWDCGEFIACSYILGVPHPPGAPVFLLVGRVFTMIPFASDIGFRVNLISAITSSLTVLFCYLIIVRVVGYWRGAPKSGRDRFLLYFSGLVGSLTFAFTDSHWFNAVETEVYSISMFFTAAVVWLILVWMERADDPGSDRYILMISYCVGLAIAIHLLNILALPFVFLVFYFRKCKVGSFREFLVHGAIAAVILGFCLLLGTVFKVAYVGLILFLVGHYFYSRSRIEEKARRYTQTALMIGGGLAIFMAIYPGIIKGIPWIADKWSLEALGVFVGVLVILMVYSVIERKRWVALLLTSLFFIVLGFSSYTVIFVRSGMDPAIDENNPETTEEMVRYLNREQYGTWATLPRRYPGLSLPFIFKQQHPNQSYEFHDFGKQVSFFWNYQFKKMYWRYFGWQFIGKGTALDEEGWVEDIVSLHGLYMLPFLVGLFGMVHHFFRDWKHALSIFVLFVMTGVAIVVYLNQPDPQPRERDYVYVGSFFAFALWIGVGVAAVLEWVSDTFRDRERRLRWVMAATSVVLFCLVPLTFGANFRSHDRSGNYVAYGYSYNILQTCEPDAILFTNGDNDTFPLWFLQEVYGVRKDVRVVNLSLLNTHWYIKQLRDQEPKVPINLSDEAIENLSYVEWKARMVGIPIPEAIREQELQRLRLKLGSVDERRVPKNLTFNLTPTYPVERPQVLRVQDLMVLRILEASRWKRPVYFAVTVSHKNMIGLNRYFRMDGLAYRVIPYLENVIEPERLRENLLTKFQYQGLDDEKVYYNPTIIKLLQNYRYAFMQLARYYVEHGRKEDASFMLDEMSRRIPADLIPYSNQRLAIFIAEIYHRIGRDPEAEKQGEYVMPGSLLSVEERIWVASHYARVLKQWDQAEEIYLQLIDRNPYDLQAYKGLFELYRMSRQYDKGIRLFEDLLIRYPGNPYVNQLLEAVKMLAASDTVSTGAGTPIK